MYVGPLVEHECVYWCMECLRLDKSHAVANHIASSHHVTISNNSVQEDKISKYRILISTSVEVSNRLDNGTNQK